MTRLEASQLDELKALAERHGYTVGALIRWCVTKSLNELKSGLEAQVSTKEE